MVTAVRERLALWNSLVVTPHCFLNPQHGHTNRDINALVRVLLEQPLTDEEVQERCREWQAEAEPKGKLAGAANDQGQTCMVQ